MTDETPAVNPIDPPDSQGGGNVTSADPEAAEYDTPYPYGVPIDPPDNQGGGTGG